MGCPDACVRERPSYTRAFCVFCRATIYTENLGRNVDSVRSKLVGLQKIKDHCNCCKAYQRALRSHRVEKGHYIVKYKYFTPKEFK